MNANNYLKTSIRESKLLLNNKNHAKTSSQVPYPCGICKFNVKHNDKALLCTECNHWIHIKCNGITIEDYKVRQIRNRENPELEESEIWSCLNCTMQERSDYVPFIQLTTTDICNLYSADLIYI